MDYSEEDKRAAVDYYFSSGTVTLRDVIDKLGYPSLRAINKWVQADPRYKTNRYTNKQKEEVVEYCRANPDATYAEVFEKFGMPKVQDTLSEWLKTAGIPRNRHYTKGEKQAILSYCEENPAVPPSKVVELFGYPNEITLSRWLNEKTGSTDNAVWMPLETLRAAVNSYFEDQRVSMRSVSDAYGIPFKLLRQAINADPRFHKGGNTQYSEEQKEKICKYALEHPEEPLASVTRRFGYPFDSHVLRKWLIKKYGLKGPDQTRYDDDLRTAVREHFFSNPDATIIGTAKLFDVGKDAAVRWITQDSRFELDSRCRKNLDRALSEATDHYFADPDATISRTAAMFGLEAKSLAGRARQDPRYSLPGTYGHSEEQKAAIMAWLLKTNGRHSRAHAEEELGFLINPRAFRIWASDARGKNGRPSSSKTVSLDERLSAVLSVVDGGKSKREVSLCHNIVIETLANWVRTYRREGAIGLVRKSDLPPGGRPDYSLPDKDPKDFSEKDVENLIGAYREREFEVDVYQAILDVLKKDPRLSGELLTNTEKTMVINALRRKYKLKDLLEKLDMAKSSYEYANKAMKKPDKYCWTRLLIRDIYESSGHAYGFRRITMALQEKYGVQVGTRVVRALMKDMNIVPLPAKKLQRYNSYRGSIGRIAPNLIKRDFHADAPYKKLLTDVTEFHLNGFKMYLSPIIDCFNGEVIEYAISTRPTLDLVMKMISDSIRHAPVTARPIVHSDQGWHYQHHEYVKALKRAGWVQSMSRKGCSPDNSACEGFFGRLKNEFFYNHEFEGFTPEMFAGALSQWIDWYNEVRTKESLGYISPVRYRLEWESQRTLAA